jgi:hypothetical protein
LTENTTGKDRKDLARWIFVAMAAHPGLRDLSNISPESRDEANKTMGLLFTKLIVENCAKEARLATQNGGAESFKSAFETLGRVAMQELMSNPEVSKGITGFQAYSDSKKIGEVLAPK